MIYFIQAGGGPIKIGTSSNVNQRVKTLQTAHWAKLRILKLVKGKSARPVYKLIRHLQLEGEWFMAERELLLYIDLIDSDGNLPEGWFPPYENGKGIHPKLWLRMYAYLDELWLESWSDGTHLTPEMLAEIAGVKVGTVNSQQWIHTLHVYYRDMDRKWVRFVVPNVKYWRAVLVAVKGKG